MKKRRRRQSPGQCPCGSGRAYGKCCGPFHRGETLPGSPEELMRSRYAAYAKELVDYVVETTDPEGAAWEEPLEKWRESIRDFGRRFEFLGVEILEAFSEGERGEVKFWARLSERATGRDASFGEQSRFVRCQGRWLYMDGEPFGEGATGA